MCLYFLFSMKTHNLKRFAHWARRKQYKQRGHSININSSSCDNISGIFFFSLLCLYCFLFFIAFFWFTFSSSPFIFVAILRIFFLVFFQLSLFPRCRFWTIWNFSFSNMYISKCDLCFRLSNTQTSSLRTTVVMVATSAKTKRKKKCGTKGI